jgi:phosphopantetheine--protein transferase-like protein
MPQHFGVGVDTEQVARWRQLLPNLRAASHRRLFSEQEHRYCESFADPAPVYAGHWCAKEAVFKAVSSVGQEAGAGGTLTIDQIEIEHLSTGCPVARLPGDWAQTLRVKVSISHDAQRALAFAVALRADASAASLEAVIAQVASARSA